MKGSGKLTDPISTITVFFLYYIISQFVDNDHKDANKADLRRLICMKSSPGDYQVSHGQELILVLADNDHDFIQGNKPI